MRVSPSRVVPRTAATSRQLRTSMRLLTPSKMLDDASRARPQFLASRGVANHEQTLGEPPQFLPGPAKVGIERRRHPERVLECHRPCHHTFDAGASLHALAHR